MTFRLIPLAVLATVLAAAPALAEDAHAARRAEFCKNNPATCQQMQDKKKECDADPQKCQQLRQEHQQRREKMQAACDANPAECQKKKDAWRKRADERAAQRQGSAPAQ